MSAQISFLYSIYIICFRLNTLFPSKFLVFSVSIQILKNFCFYPHSCFSLFFPYSFFLCFYQDLYIFFVSIKINNIFLCFYPDSYFFCFYPYSCFSLFLSRFTFVSIFIHILVFLCFYQDQYVSLFISRCLFFSVSIQIHIFFLFLSLF